MVYSPVALGYWGKCAERGPGFILDYLKMCDPGNSILFVGTSTRMIDYQSIISSCKEVDPECEITFSDISEFPEEICQEFSVVGVNFIQLDVNEITELNRNWDFIIAFGLFSKTAFPELWDDASRIITNILSVISSRGLIAISVDSTNEGEFLRVLDEIRPPIGVKTVSGYQRGFGPISKSEFNITKNNPFRRHAATVKFDTWDDYIANEVFDKRTNFFISKPN